MKWNENGHECELRLVLNGGEWEGPQGREVLPRDLIAALRANPDVRSEVFRELLPVILAEHDASESRALAAEKERDTWCDTAHALKRERDVAQEHARRAQADATGWGLRLGDAEEKARSAERTAKHYFDQYEALREERDATLSKLAGVEQELTRELSYNLQLLRDIDALRKVVAWMRQLRDEDFLQCERPNRDEGDECTCVPCSARSALSRLDARGSAAPTGQDVEAERSEWKALADEFARDAVSLEPAREIVAEYRRAKAKFGPFHNGHEGYAVLLEEVDELWEAVRMQYGPERDAQMRKEVVQVGAMALRFLLDVCAARAALAETEENER